MSEYNNFKYSNNIDSPDFNKLYDQHFFDSQFSGYLYNQDSNESNYNSKHLNEPGMEDNKFYQPDSQNHGLNLHQNQMNPANTSLFKDFDGSIKRKLSGEDDKKEINPRPFQPVRQISNPNIIKRKGRPAMNKSLSYNLPNKNEHPSYSYTHQMGSTPPNPSSLNQFKHQRSTSQNYPTQSFQHQQPHSLQHAYQPHQQSHLNSQLSPPTNHLQIHKSPNPQLENQSQHFDKPKAKPFFPLNKRKPNFHINLDNLSNSPALNSNSSNLSIVDNDLNFDDRFENVTPNMKPPGTKEDDYFEDNLIPSNFEESNDLTGFNFNLYEDKGTSSFGFDNYKNFDYQNFDLLNEKSDYKANQNDYQDKQELNYFERNDFGPQFDKNFEIFLDRSENEKNEYEHYGKAELSNEEFENRDKKSPSTPLSNDISNDSPTNSKLSPYSNNQLNPEYLSTELYRTTSNQSNSSIKSGDKKKKVTPKGATCPICGKYISRDLSRHLRIHDENGRFRCVFPKICSHKTGKFNRPYDYKKHLLHFHFKFDDPKGKAATNLTDKLPLMGNCKACNFRSDAKTWIDDHVLTTNSLVRCRFVDGSPDSTQ
ncbi:hypothetical protein CLIB1444_21S00628 [[Candida] jaroonii]|uniref:Uncharacterized protein n=1 Tax=[Candida] jaroonii TaxID=467808 RepID=A0ACA9YFL1_9ASCO|nr:hypothetical protein CLIB1444_21S00628 [[Candida] jaroonii]